MNNEVAQSNYKTSVILAMVGMSRKTINTVENNVFIPSTVLAIRLARALSTSVEELFQLSSKVPWHRGAQRHESSLRSGMFFAACRPSSERPDVSFQKVRMASGRISNGGWLAIGLAILGGLIALANVIVRYQRSGDIAWGKLALAIGVPILIYAMVSGRRNGGPKA